jgi:putative membrane protein
LEASGNESPRNEEVVIAMMWGWNGMAAGGWIIMTVVWVAVIGLVVWAVTALFPRGRGHDQVPRETPKDILDRRFARGELGAEEYREMRDELRSGARR